VSALGPHPASATSIELEYGKRLMLFSGRSNPALAAKIAGKLNVDLGGVTLKTFSNGEVYCRYEESIRGADVFIVQPTCGNPVTGITANDALMELLVMVDAAVGASAHRVIAVTPWYGYSRQDKKSNPREPITARLVARMLEAAGMDRVLTMDLHSGQIQGFFQKPVDHMTALFMLTQYFRDQGLEDIVVVSPDAGRVKLNKRFAAQIGAELAILNKERPAQQVAEIGYVIGDVRDKTAVIVDDMIDTAGTLKAAARRVLRRRVREPRLLAFRGDRRHGHDPAAPRRARQHPRALLRGAADRLDPPHLHRRLGERRVRRREPALLTSPAWRRGLRAICSRNAHGSQLVVGDRSRHPRADQLVELAGDGEAGRVILEHLGIEQRDLGKRSSGGADYLVIRLGARHVLQERKETRRPLGRSCQSLASWRRPRLCDLQ
jgi:ribose-phosphate pyrophosphokinase